MDLFLLIPLAIIALSFYLTFRKEEEVEVDPDARPEDLDGLFDELHNGPTILDAMTDPFIDKMYFGGLYHPHNRMDREFFENDD